MPPEITTIDYESEAIERRPAYPPKPVGVAIKYPGKRSKYLSWGAPTENNCTIDEAKRELRDIWRGKNSILCQHGKFDLDVGEVHMGLPPLPWERTEDTEYLLFLHDPHARSLALKESAERILGTKPEERDLLKEWILAHVPEAKRRPSKWGAHICKAPGKLVGRYACGDTERTWGLRKFLHPEIVKRGMLHAYQRELRLMPVLLENERRGIRADLERMEYDHVIYLLMREAADEWLRRALKSPNLNLDADKDVANALADAGVVTEWTYTEPTKTHPSGVRSISKKNMPLERFHNKKIASVYGYRVRLSTCISMFFRPWLEMARSNSDQLIYTNWNSVRQASGNGLVGARTGRMSCNPNFMNIPKDFEDKDDGYVHPSFSSLAALPLMRKYLLPDKGETWGHRDINQQELRFTAHFEDGALCQRYNDEPRFDIHSTMQAFILEDLGIALTRNGVKILNFADLYGRGLGELAKGLNVDAATAKRVKAAKAALMPEVDELNKNVKMRGESGEAIVTWGGRQYYCEPPMFVKKHKRVMTFAYKLLNYLVQGSSADFTKEAIIAYHNHPKRQARFLVAVHDELNASMGNVKREMEVLREAIENIPGVDVPMLTDGKTGSCWGELTKYVN